MTFLQLTLVLAFLAVARYLDSENRRVNATNTRLLRQRRKAAVRIVRLRRALGDAEEVCVELGRECDAYRDEERRRRESPRYAFVIPHIPSETRDYPGCECAGCARVRAGVN